MSKYDPESVLPTIDEMDVASMSSDQEEELVRSMRNEERMTEWWASQQGCSHDYSPCPCEGE